MIRATIIGRVCGWKCVALSLLLFLLSSPDPMVAAEQTDGAADPSTPASIYGQGVRPTDWQSAEEERRGFHLPPGFEIRLVASEPQITKPLNMAFDRRGRLWVTQSVEYPYPAADDVVPRDSVMVLSDTDGDGRADEITEFADKLNIPIGILPYGDGCLCFSIPNILYLRDTDGDGKCDRRDVILGPFDTTRDAHGMINAMRDGGDGWIYACHGFNNRSEVTGGDGHAVQMPSGNTFRFRPDGSRIEVYTHGQVNPFGMTEDHWGYRYSADCHSKPITQLIRDACYPSFGRPHDGLGFLPPMVEHLHGSTAICGIVHFSPETQIAPLRNQMISGNVMTSRLNRNAVTYRGATAVGTELPDFMTSDDSWFRPVDIQLGPDGHLYVADFYNKIIGHYEVPLDHPERDRTSGRIWQIRYTGDASSQATSKATSNATDAETMRGEAMLRSTNPTVRRFAEPTSPVEVGLFKTVANDPAESSSTRVAAIRSLRVAKAIDGAGLVRLGRDSDDRVRVEALRIAEDMFAIGLSAKSVDAVAMHDLAVKSLAAANAHVVQASASMLGRTGNDGDVEPLFAALDRVRSDDSVTRQTIRIALRNLYRDSPADSPIWKREADADFANVMLGLERPEMIDGVLSYLASHPSAANREELLKHAAAHSTEETLVQCVEMAKTMTAKTETQFQLLEVLAQSQNAGPGTTVAPLVAWATELVEGELDRFDSAAGQGTAVAWSTSDGAPWPTRERTLRSGQNVQLVDSITRGEKYTGILRSDAFVSPARLRFWLAGHNGMPEEDDHQKNKVRLVDANSGEVLLEAFPPRHDVAREVVWDTGKWAGREVRIDCIDGDSGRAYAWLAIGQFEPSWVFRLGPNESLYTATEWIKRLGLGAMQPRLLSYLKTHDLSRLLRIELAATIASLRGQSEMRVSLQFLSRPGVGREVSDRLITSLIDGSQDDVPEAIRLLTKELSSNSQRDFALAWVRGGANASQLLQMCEDGWLSPAALADVDVLQALMPKLGAAEAKTLVAITKDVDDGSAKRKVIEDLRQQIASVTADLDNGHQVFKKNCAACHQLRGEGVVVGPQLDGAVTRSVQRLLEDIVTPDQNVDRAFRTTSFLLDDGRVVVGLVRSETDQGVTLVESTGKVAVIDPEAIEQRREAGRSLMPSNFAEIISANDFADMMRFIRQ